MEAAEIQLFRHATSAFSERIAEEFARQDSGFHFCVFKFFTVTLPATRMSGDPWTSLGNGFTNYLVFKFVCKHCNCECIGFVEGDDGIFRVTVLPGGWFPQAADFERLGLNIKLEMHDELNEASFCGVIFDPVEKTAITDPWKVLCNFGWAEGRYAEANDKTLAVLTRAKALSLACQYSGCPIIDALAHKALDLTRGVDVRKVLKDNRIGTHEYEKLTFALEKTKQTKPWMHRKPVGHASRDIVARKFGIPIEYQLRAEQIIEESEGWFDLPFLLEIMPKEPQLYWDNYVVEVPLSKNVFYPPL